MKRIAIAFAGLAAAVLFSAQALADGVIQSLKGDVRVDRDAAVPTQRVFSGMTITTGGGAMATLVFDDKQQVVLNENTTFKLTDFRYRPQQPRGDRAVFDLLRGALRFISGVVGARSPNTVALRTPQATIGIRGTDFMLAIVNPLYVSVIQGSIASSNTAGSVVFGQGALGQVASSSALAAPIPASALPPAASGAFSNLAAAQVSAAVTPAVAEGVASGAATGAAAAAPTAGVGAAIAIGVGAAIVGTAIDEGDASAVTHH